MYGFWGVLLFFCRSWGNGNYTQFCRNVIFRHNMLKHFDRNMSGEYRITMRGKKLQSA